MPVKSATELDLGTVLLEKKAITREQLKECQEKQRLRGGYLSQHLIDRGYIKDSDLTTTLTCQYGFCYLPLTAYSVSENAFGIIPPELLRDYICLPIEKNERLLSVVMADPLNKGVIEALRQASRCEIIVFISSRKEIREAIEKYYKIPLKDVDLDRFKNDPSLREGENYVHTATYSGPNRRRYTRWNISLTGKSYLYPNILGVKIKNIGMKGIGFMSYMPLAKGAQTAMTIQLSNTRSFTTVLEVSRCEARSATRTLPSDSSSALYEVGEFFNFLSEEQQLMLADFLKRLPTD